jgi:hypothetical protein
MCRQRSEEVTTMIAELAEWDSFYVMLGSAAAALFIVPSYLTEMLFCTGASVLLLLVTGIHNTWDNVSYGVRHMRDERTSRGTPDET